MPQMKQDRRLALMEVAEIKRIATAIEHAADGQMPVSLLVTSAVRDEGKSLLAASLAASLAATAATTGPYRVAAFDLHWRRPALHQFFGLGLGFDSAAMLEANLTDLIQASGQDGLDILTAPKDHAGVSVSGTELLRAMARLIDQCRSTYDLVIIDSAPVFPTNRLMIDPIVLASLVQGVIMVVLHEATPKQQVRKAQKTLEAAGANLLGVISNQGRSSVAASRRAASRSATGDRP